MRQPGARARVRTVFGETPFTAVVCGLFLAAVTWPLLQESSSTPMSVVLYSMFGAWLAFVAVLALVAWALGARGRQSDV